MIDKAKFAAGLGVLAGAFGREIDENIIRAYYHVLSAKLTTEEFERAVQAALETETYWPAPAVLLRKVKVAPTDEGEDALRAVNRLIGQHGGVQFLSYAAWETLDAPTKAAVLACGGLREIEDVPKDRYAALRKKFIEAYDRAKNGPPSLPKAEGEMDPRVKSLIRGLAGRPTRNGRDRAAGVERDD